MKTALIAGASGMIGSELCRQQLAFENSEFDRVVALTRRPLDFSYGGEKLVEQRADFGNLDQLSSSVGSVDIAFCTLGTTIKTAGSPEAFRLVDHDYVVAFARLAKSAGAKTFVLLTSVGANPKSSTFYLKVKGEAEIGVAALGFESLYLFRPSILVGDRQEVRPGERIGIAVGKLLQFGMVGPVRKYRPIESATVAGGMRGAAIESRRGQTVCEFSEIVRLSAVAVKLQ